jgi:hypothetical protein
MKAGQTERRRNTEVVGISAHCSSIFYFFLIFIQQPFQIVCVGDQTADPWVPSPTISPYTTGTSQQYILKPKIKVLIGSSASSSYIYLSLFFENCLLSFRN